MWGKLGDKLPTLPESSFLLTGFRVSIVSAFIVSINQHATSASHWLERALSISCVLTKELSGNWLTRTFPVYLSSRCWIVSFSWPASRSPTRRAIRGGLWLCPWTAWSVFTDAVHLQTQVSDCRDSTPHHPAGRVRSDLPSIFPSPKILFHFTNRAKIGPGFCCILHLLCSSCCHD